MKKLKKLYQLSSLFPVYNSLTTGGRARSSLLAAVVVQAVISGFTTGIFYTGLLVGYGINIVNISILSIIPNVCSFFGLLSPLVFRHFKRRRVVLSVTRLLYYTVNILGFTLLPQLVQSDGGRIAGLIVISFVTNSLNAIFSPGYSPWHMSHITEDIRVNYFSSTALVSFISSSTVLMLAGMATDRLTGDDRLNLIIALRYIAYAAAILDVYFLQKPKEPVYQVSDTRLSVLNVIRIPLSNRSFVLTALIHATYSFIICLTSSTLNAWLLEEVQVSYLYVNGITAIYCLFIPLTTPIWSKMMRRRGTFCTLALAMALQAPTYFLWALVNHGNYLWLMTILRLIQHTVGMGCNLSCNNLIYVNIPEVDQDNYLVFFNQINNVAGLLCNLTSTAIVAAMGNSALTLFGRTFTCVPVLLLIETVLGLLLPVMILLLRPWMDPMYQRKKAK